MHIESIILDGFKSYSTRTVIGPLDPHFNAVTGLNGSGKSNVLDSLCFVFGISDLSCVRASKLDELIYKQGQAGITKATVTVVFDNSGPMSPLPEPYRKMPQVTVTRQIAIGGRNRHFLNSHPATPKAIADFFQAARMNVNNARFLIMQGRVTKVVNMKPKELLTLIEEASGTRLYEAKRASAVKLMTRKEQKLEEIRKVLTEDISPCMEKLKNDRNDYLQWVGMKDEENRLQSFKVAYTYWKAKEEYRNGLQKQEELREEKQTVEDTLQTMEKECLRYKENIKKMEKEASTDETLSVQVTYDELKKEVGRLESKGRIIEKDIEEIIQAKEVINREMHEAKKKLETKKKASSAEASTLEKLQNTIAEQREELQALEGSIGTSNAKTQQTQLKELKTQVSKLEAEENATVEIMKHMKGEMNDADKLKVELQKTFTSKMEDVEKKIEQITSKLEDLQKKQAELPPMQSMKKQLQDLTHTSEEFDSKIHQLEVDLARYRIPYKNGPGIYGQVFEILGIKDPEYSVPLHILTGHKLGYIVVDNKDTAARVFKENGYANGKRRVTILPLDEAVEGRVVTPHDMSQCKRLIGGSENQISYYADVLAFEPKFNKLARYITGGAIFCRTSELARKIAYEYGFPTATVEGDRFDVKGSMSGGSTTNVKMTLLAATEINKAKQGKEDCKKKMEEIRAKLDEVETLLHTQTEFQRDLEMHKVSLQGLESRMQSSPAYIALNKVQEMQRKYDEMEEELEGKRELIKSIRTKIESLQKTQEKHDAGNRIKELKKSIRAATTQLDTMQESMLSVQIEFDNLEHQIGALNTESQTKETELQTLQSDMRVLQTELSTKKEQLKNVELELKEKMEEIHSRRSELQEKTQELQRKQTEVQEGRKRLKELDYTLEELSKGVDESQVITSKLKRENPWITAEEERFNVDPVYNFTDVRLEAVQKRLDELHSAKATLMVNDKAEQMYERVAGEYADLQTKMEKVERDRGKIKDVIAELDVKKLQSVETLFVRINEYFGSIFNILSGAEAKLVPIDGDITNGITMHVGFNGRWKSTLSELSGGQRSLLALSLILAMLKVRPAPVYILDEIDAALDLSHTQNIGKMIKTQFPNSQFIIVSLKEGMFSNANVIFRTKFIDGASTISRQTGMKRSRQE